jgi:peptidyl-prolyl cis-trans isomerase D
MGKDFWSMIAFMRKGLASWLVLGILGLVVAAFVITGIGDPFGTSTGKGATVAKVGRDKITTDTLQQELLRKVKELQAQNPELTMEQVVKGGGAQGMLDGLAGRLALEHFMRETGITGGPKAVAGIIAKEQAFQLGGVFNKKLYEDTLRREGLTQAVYEQQMTADIGRAQLLGSISRGWSLPDAVVLAYASLLEEKRVAQIAIVPGSGMGVPPIPTDAQLDVFYKKHLERYRAPELRNFRSFVLEPSMLTAKVTVSDADVQAYVAKNSKTLGTAETRTIQQVTLDSQEAATALIATVKAGSDFATAAKAAVPGLTDTDLTRADILQSELATDIGDNPAQAIFKLAQGGITAPIETDIGWQLFRVASINAGKGATLDAATRAKAIAALQIEKATNMLFDLTTKVDDAAAKRKGFDDLAKIADVTPTSYGPMSSRGTDANGQPSADAQSAGKILQLAFNRRAGDDLALEEVGENAYALVEVTKVIASAPRPLAQMKPLVVAEWQRDELNARAKAAAEKIAAAMRAGKPLALAAAGFPMQPNFTISRADLAQSKQTPPEVIVSIFKGKKGDVRVTAGPNGNGYAVLQVTAVQPATATRSSPVYAGLKQSIDQYSNMEAQAQFVIAAKKLAKVEINQPALKQFTQKRLGE